MDREVLALGSLQLHLCEAIKVLEVNINRQAQQVRLILTDNAQSLRINAKGLLNGIQEIIKNHCFASTLIPKKRTTPSLLAVSYSSQTSGAQPHSLGQDVCKLHPQN